MLGKHQSLETRRKIAESSKNRTHSEETKQKMSQAHKGIKFTKEHKLNLSKSHQGERNHNWVGELVGYNGLHLRIKKALGSPSICENCDTINAKRYEWANISGEYKTDISDWVRLCAVCHHLFDDIYRKRKQNKVMV